MSLDLNHRTSAWDHLTDTMLFLNLCTIASVLASISVTAVHHDNRDNHQHRRLHRREVAQSSQVMYDDDLAPSLAQWKPGATEPRVVQPVTDVEVRTVVISAAPLTAAPMPTGGVAPTVSRIHQSSLAHLITKAKRAQTACANKFPTPTATIKDTTDCSNVEGALGSWTTSYTTGTSNGGGALAVLACYSSDPVSVTKRSAYSSPASLTPTCSREYQAFYNCFEDWTHYAANLECCDFVVLPAPPPITDPSEYLTCTYTAESVNLEVLSTCFESGLFSPGLTQKTVQETVVSTTTAVQTMPRPVPTSYTTTVVQPG